MNILRLGTLSWEGRNEVYRRSRKQVVEGVTKSGKDILKFMWKCAVCHVWYREKSDLEADHILEVGPLENNDWSAFINRLYVEPEKWQLLCSSCHAKKTATYAAHRSFKRKNIIPE